MWVVIVIGLITTAIGEDTESRHSVKKIDDFENVWLPESKLGRPTEYALLVKKYSNDDSSTHSNMRKIRDAEQSLRYNSFRGPYETSHSQERSATINEESIHSGIHLNVPDDKESYVDQHHLQKLLLVPPNYTIGTRFSFPNFKIQSSTYVLPTLNQNSRHSEFAPLLNNPNLKKSEEKKNLQPLSYEQETNDDYGSEKSSSKLYYHNPEYQQYHVELTNQRQIHDSKNNNLPTVQDHQLLQQIKPHPVSYSSPSQYVSSNITPKNIPTHAKMFSSAQSQAEAQALEFRKISHSAHLEHQRAALNQIRLGIERHNQESALEKINQGQLSDAGKKYVEKNSGFSDPQLIQEAQLRSRISEKVAETRKNQEAIEYKAHSDAILALQKQQAAHLKAQEDAHIFALNFEQNQVNAQAKAQALANAQAVILYKAHRAAHVKAQNEAKNVARAQANARFHDPEHTPVIQYLLPQKQSFSELDSHLS